MCVDDESVVLTSLMGQLNNAFGDRYDYESFSNPQEAYEFIDEMYCDGMDVDLIICDWLMPQMRGDEFMVRIHRRFPNIRLIMLSGHADQQSVERAKEEANMLTFLAKPWEKEELIRFVEAAMAD
jgi:CheY-like chemotaxis protein